MGHPQVLEQPTIGHRVNRLTGPPARKPLDWATRPPGSGTTYYWFGLRVNGGALPRAAKSLGSGERTHAPFDTKTILFRICSTVTSRSSSSNVGASGFCRILP